MSMTPQQAYTQALNLFQAGEPQEALTLTIQLARQGRTHPPTRLVHGLALAGAGRPFEASQEFRAAGELMDRAPDQEATEVRALRTRSRCELSRALTEIGQTTEAIDEADAVLATDEYHTLALAAKARAQLAAGDAKGAATTLKPMLIGDASDPEVALAAAEVALHSDALTAAEVIPNLEPLVKQVGHPTRLLRPMLRALGMLLDADGRHDDAWVALRRGSNLSVAEFDPKAFGGAVATLVQNWTPEAMRTVKRPTEPSPALVVVGLAGSRTDAVGRILAAHPEGGWGGRTLTLRQMSERFLDAKPTGGIPLVASPVTVRGKSCTEAAKVYEMRLRQRTSSDDAKVIADTNPDNVPLLGIAALIVPGLRVINMRRAPVDACFEAYAMESTPGVPHACDQVSIAAHAHGTSRLIDHWRSVLGDEALGVSWLDVEFDELRSDPEGTARKIVEFAGLEWDDACAEAARAEAAAPALDAGAYASHIKQMTSGLGPLASVRA